jgi:chondroitin 4-sulfotransferase 11
MKKWIQELKLFIKSNYYFNLIARSFYRILPVVCKERLSNISNVPYSEVEMQNNVIFVHVPKNAGNAIMNNLYNVKGQGHNKISEYELYDNARFNSSFKFGVVRHPIDRFISAFEYLKSGGMGLYDSEFSEKYLKGYNTSDDLCRSMMSSKRLENTILSWTHFIPQFKYFESNGTFKLDYLICYDYLEIGIAEVRNKLGMEVKLEVESINTTKRIKTLINDTSVEEYLLNLYSQDTNYYIKSKNEV